MKKLVYKISSAFLAGLLFFTVNMNAQTWKGQDPAAMEAIYTGGTITLDGKLDEAAWGSTYEYLVFGPSAATTLNAKSVTGEVLVRGPYKDSTVTTVKFLRKGTNLYIGISSNDKSVCSFGDSWEGDGIFMKIKTAAGADKEIKYYFNKQGVNPVMNFDTDTTLAKGASVKGTTTIVNDTTQVDNGFTAELCIYLDKFGYTSATTEIPVMINIFDPDGYMGTAGAWNPNGIGTFDKTYWGSEWGPTFRKLVLYQDPASIDVPLTAKALTIDGKLDEGEWSADMNYLVFGPQAPTSAKAKSVTGGALVWGAYKDTTHTVVKLLRNGMNLYIGLSSNDKSVGKFGDSWEGDGLFMKIKKADGSDQEYKLYFNQGGVNPNINFDQDTSLGKGAAVKGSSTIVNDTTQVDNGYTAELLINLSKLGYTTAPATVQVLMNIFDPDGYVSTMTPWGKAGTYYKTWWGSEWGPDMRTLNLTSTVVPVELSAFNAVAANGQVKLNWRTSTETNNKGFAIERSSDNKNFTEIAFVNGKGTTAQAQSYSYTDNVSAGTLYYRLRQVDFDGQYAVSSVVTVNVTAPVKFALDQNYPNPFNPSTTIRFGLQSDSKVAVKVFDMLGREVATAINGNFTAGAHSFVFNASQLASGNYIYQITAVGVDGNRQVMSKIMTLTK